MLDEVSCQHAGNLDYVIVSERTLNFNADESGMNIFLDKTEGLMFPSALNDNFDVESNVEFY